MEVTAMESDEKQELSSAEEQYRKMTQEPVSHLILSLSLPTIVSMLVTNVYNMADTWFVSGIGTSASGATGVVFGLMAILQAFGFMFGHGAGSNISRLLGARNVEHARNFSADSFYLSIGHPIAAVCIRTSTERPEALEAGDFILAGITTDELLNATSMAIEMKRKGVLGKPCPDYVDETVSMKVVRIIQGYVGVVNKMVWRKS